MRNLLKNLLTKNLTISRGRGDFSRTREILTRPNRETKEEKLMMESLSCPYCSSLKFVRRGFRQKKFEKVQLYLCSSCGKTFSQQTTKGKHYPLKAIFDALSTYNLGYSLEETCKIVNQTKQFNLRPSTLSNWLAETEGLCKFNRMREYALKKFSPRDMVITATLAHRQLYRYRFHQAKCKLIISEDFKHRRFGPLQEFLEMVPAECPHQYFQEGRRASEAPLTFSKKQMIVRSKQNYATQLAEFVLQSVKNRTLRHEALQKFMLYNDSVTVATEVPVYITSDDLEHMRTQLGFEISDSPKLITGHIDVLQIRNGQVHILDYKSKAEKERPIEQLTLYAMALSRLTGLRLFEFKCAWFNEKDYFEFYPLHVLHKPRKNRRRRRIYTMEGIYQINKNDKKIERIRPIL